ncbi:MAG: GNAT family N-acetyltransferase [Heyndrickxia sp.]
MEIKSAEVSDASLIHDLMMKAFKEVAPPSSALEETVDSISNALKDKENGLIAYVEEKPVGMVRFQIVENGLYFYRLSVLPEYQGKGIAKKILTSLEDYAKQKEIPTLLCKVRLAISKNIQLYRSMDYRIYDEEIVHKPNGIKIKTVSMMKQI